MKKILFLFVGVVGVFIAAVMAAPFFISTDVIKTQLVSYIESATGRQITINGALTFSVFPSVGVEAEQVSLSNPPGFDDTTPFIVLKRMHIGVALMPLLQKDLQFTDFSLEEPKLNLIVNNDGRRNWLFSPRKTDTVANEDSAGESPVSVSAAGGAKPEDKPTLEKIHLTDISIHSGDFTYKDLIHSKEYVMSGIEATLAASDISAPIELDLSANWQKKAFSLSGRVDKPIALIDGSGTTPFVFSMKTPHGDFSAKGSGQIDLAQADISFNSASLKQLQAWAMPDVPVADIPTPLALKGSSKLAYRDSTLNLTELAFNLDGIEASGDVQLTVANQRPDIIFTLKTGELDLNKFIKPEESKAAALIRDVFVKDAHAAQPHWSAEPIDVSALKSIDIAGNLFASELRIKDMSMTEPQIQTKLKAGRFDLSIPRFGMYRGSGSLMLAVDSTLVPMQIRLENKLFRFDVADILKQVASAQGLRGMGTIDLKIDSRGNNQQELVRNLNGAGSFLIEKGVYEKANLLDMFNNIASAFNNPDVQPAYATDFSTASGTFMIQNGVLRNDDFKLMTLRAAVSGSGEVNLPAYTLNYRLVPTSLGETTDASGVAQVREGMLIPVLITGSLEKPIFQPDLQATVQQAIQDPEALKEQLKNTRRNLKDQFVKDPKEAIKNIKGLLNGF